MQPHQHLVCRQEQRSVPAGLRCAAPHWHMHHILVACTQNLETRYQLELRSGRLMLQGVLRRQLQAPQPHKAARGTDCEQHRRSAGPASTAAGRPAGCGAVACVTTGGWAAASGSCREDGGPGCGDCGQRWRRRSLRLLGRLSGAPMAGCCSKTTLVSAGSADAAGVALAIIPSHGQA